MKFRTSPAPSFVVSVFSIFLVVHSPASRAQTNDVFAGDARLSTKRTVKLPGRALSSALPEIGKLCGVTLNLDPTAPDEILVLSAHDRTVTDTLRAISSLYKLEWKKIENAGAVSYTLLQSPEAKAAADNSARIDDEQVAKLILSDAKTIREFSEMSDDLLAKLPAQLIEQISKEANPEVRQDLEHKRILLQAVRNDYAVIAAKLIDLVGVKPITDARKGLMTEYHQPAPQGKLSIPAVVESAIAASIRKGAANGANNQYNAYSIKIGPSQTSSDVTVIVELKTEGPNAGGGNSFRTNFPYNSLPKLPNRALNSPNTWKGVRSLNQEVLVAIPPPTANRSAKDAFVSTYVDSILYVDSQVPVDIVSDAFFSDTALLRYEANNVILGEALNRLSTAYNRSWSYSDGFVQLRSNQHDVEVRDAPSAGMVEQVLAKVDSGLFAFEDLLNLAGLPMSQFRTLESLILGRPPSSSPASTPRSLLIAIRKLPPQQRKLALTDGLPLSSLSLETRAELIAGFAETRGGQTRLIANGDFKSAELASCTLEIRESGRQMWGCRRMTSGNYGTYPTKEAALQVLQNRVPNIQSEDIKPCNIRTVSIRIKGIPDIFTQSVVLPPQWLEGSD